MKITKIIYWTSTVLLALSLGMASLQYLSHNPDMDAAMNGHLGYPKYFMDILGVAKLLGAVFLLLPNFPRVKEWAYAGVFFTLTGAAWTHWAVDGPATIAAPVIMLIILAVSYTSYHKIENRKAKAVF